MTAAEWIDAARAAGLTIAGTYDVENGVAMSFNVGAGSCGFRREVWEPLCLALSDVMILDVIDELARRASRGRP